MSKKSITSNNHSSIARIIITFLIIILGIGVAYFVISDIQARTAFTVVSDEALRIEQVGITPLGFRPAALPYEEALGKLHKISR